MSIHENHLEELRRSGLTDTTIEKAGIRSVNSAEIADTLGWKSKKWDFGDGILFPFNGTGFAQVKADFPRAGENGKVRKYESPKGKHVEPYLPPGFEERLKTAAVVVVTEGVKKCLALSQQGYCTVGLVGVWGFQQPRQKTDTGRTYGERKLIPALDKIDWTSKTVIIVFDSDAADNHMVQLAEWKLAEVLQSKNATTKIVRLPAGDDGAKVGVDDFLVARGEAGPAELQRLIDEAKPAECPPTPNEMEWARMYLDDQWRHPEGLTLRWHRDVFYAWTGTHYKAMPDSELSAILTVWLDERKASTKARTVSEIIHNLRALCRIPFTTDPPAWTEGESPADPADVVAMENSILFLSRAAAGDDNATIPHTPRLFCMNALPYRFNPKAECPVWFSFLNAVFDGDIERVNLLADWFGYCLTTDTRQQAMLMLVGPPRSGKGVTLRTLRHVVGPENCVDPRLTTLSQTFGLWGLLDKRVAIVPDAHLGHGDAAMSVLELLKSISGEDSVEVQRKNLPPVNVRLRVRVTLAVNDLPKFGDSAGALGPRLLLLPYLNSYEGKEDRDLEEKIALETPGILNWALWGLSNLRANGGFTRPEASEAMRSEYARLCSPIRAFTEDCCVVAPTLQEPRENVWAAWVRWCEKNGHLAGSRELLGARLRSLIPRLDETRPRGEDGKRQRVYVGLELRPEVVGVA